MKHRMWKKMLLCLVAGAMVFGTCACGNKDGDEKTENEQTKGETLAYENEEALNLWDNVEDMPYYDAEITTEGISTITPYIVEDGARKGCVIICPGGGYEAVAFEKEGVEPAKAFNEQGISAFVLEYRVAPYNYQAILSDVCRAVRYVRYYAEEFAINPDRIAIMGFSAGGHLAAMNLEHAAEDQQQLDDIDTMDAQADYGILCYPVITLEGNFAHEGSKENFLGAENVDDAELAKKYSAHNNIDGEMSPCFVWHCKGDDAVPYQNSQAFANMMTKAGVNCQLELYENGAHGIGMAEQYDGAKEWFSQCLTWLEENRFYEQPKKARDLQTIQRSSFRRYGRRPLPA